MRRFNFPLETLLRVRKQKEEIARRDFAVALGKKVAQEELISSILDAARLAGEEFAAAGVGTLRVDDILAFHRFISGQAARYAEARDELSSLFERMEDARGVLVETRKLRRAVEILREKHYRRYVKEVGREEQKELDEVTSNREAMKAMERGD